MKKQTKNNATASSDRLQSFQKLRSNTASPCTGIGVSQIRFVCGSLNEIAATLAMALPREILETRDRYVHSFVFTAIDAIVRSSLGRHVQISIDDEWDAPTQKKTVEIKVNVVFQ